MLLTSFPLPINSQLEDIFIIRIKYSFLNRNILLETYRKRNDFRKKWQLNCFWKSNGTRALQRVGNIFEAQNLSLKHFGHEQRTKHKICRP